MNRRHLHTQTTERKTLEYNKLLDPIKVGTRIRPGDCLILLQYKLIMDEISKKVKKKKDTRINDTILMVQSEDAIQRMVHQFYNTV